MLTRRREREKGPASAEPAQMAPARHATTVATARTMATTWWRLDRSDTGPSLGAVAPGGAIRRDPSPARSGKRARQSSGEDLRPRCERCRATNDPSVVGGVRSATAPGRGLAPLGWFYQRIYLVRDRTVTPDAGTLTRRRGAGNLRSTRAAERSA